MSRISFFPLRLLVFIVLPACSGIGQAGETNLWDRPALIGASASSGFTMLELFGGPRTETLGLQTNLAVLIKAGHGPFADHSERQFYLDPQTHGDRKTKQALAGNPTVVFAPDFLFWFVYGRMENEATRLLVLADGLNYLGRFTCPVVVGSIPDATAAAGLMLRKYQLPTAKTLAKANEQIRDWASKRDNPVAVLALDTFMAQSLANKEIRLRHRVFPAGTTGKLFQADKLHPNQGGARVFALALLEALQAEVPFPEADIDWRLPLSKSFAPSPVPVPAK